MNGWIERNEKIKNQIINRLKELPPIFNDFYIDMQGDGKSMLTIKNYINYVANFMEFIIGKTQQNDFYKNITPMQIKQFLISLETKQIGDNIAKMSDDYRALNWSAVNTFFNFLMVNDYIQANPMLKTKRPKIQTEHKVVYMDKSEIATVMKSIEDNYTGNMLTRDRAIIGLALTTGLRVSALVQINLEDIDYENSIIKVIEKRMKTRKISIGDNSKQLLQDWVQVRNEKYGNVDTNALFLSQWGRRITTNGVRDLFTKYTKHLSKHITPHKARSSMACNAFADGMSILAIQDRMAHGNITTTRRYLDSMNDDEKKLIDCTDKLI